MKRLLPILCFVFVAILFTHCKKEKDAVPGNPDPNVGQPPVVPPGTLVKADKVITLTKTDHSSSPEDISSGKLVILTQNTLKSIVPGTILVQEGADGFLVEVTEKNGSTLKVTPAALDQLFKSGKISFTSNTSVAGGKLASYGYTLNKEIFNEAGLKMSLTGTASFNPNLTADMEFSLSGNSTLNVKMENAQLNLEGQLAVNAQPTGNLNVVREIELGELTRSALVSGVYTTFKVKLIDRITISGKADIDEVITFNSENLINANLDYNGTWTTGASFTNIKNTVKLGMTAKATLKIKHEIIPSLTVEFFKVAGLYVKPKPYNNFNYNAFVEPLAGVLLWNHSVEKGMDLEIGATSRIFKAKDFPLKNIPLIDPTLIYAAPKNLKIKSGDGQKGIMGKPLEKPFEVEVLDSESNPLAGVMVFFTIEKGGGSISQKVLTNSSGVASTTYTFGTEDVSSVKATIKDSNQNPLGEVTFNATADCADPIKLKFWGIDHVVTKEGQNGSYTQDYTLDFNITDPCNMIGKAKEAYLVQMWTNGDASGGPIKHDLKSYAGRNYFDLSITGNASYYWINQTQTHCCKVRYTFELIVDGKSFGNASAVSP